MWKTGFFEGPGMEKKGIKTNRFTRLQEKQVFKHNFLPCC